MSYIQAFIKWLKVDAVFLCVFCFLFIKMWLKRWNKRSKGKMRVAAMHLILCGQMSQTTYLLQCFFIIIFFFSFPPHVN